MKFRLLTFFLIVLLFLSLAAATAHAGAPPKACDLLTPQIASTILGGPVGTASNIQDILCSYSAKGGGGSVTVHVVADSGMTPEMYKANLAFSKFEAVPNLGDAAFFISTGNPGVQVLYHGTVLTVGVTSKVTPEMKSRLVQAARYMVGKL